MLTKVTRVKIKVRQHCVSGWKLDQNLSYTKSKKWKNNLIEVTVYFTSIYLHDASEFGVCNFLQYTNI